MLALSSLLGFQSNCVEWPPLEKQKTCRVEEEEEASESLFGALMAAEGEKYEESGWRVLGDDGGVMAKKFNHNASERDRRKKLNLLFYSLRSLLPLANQRKRVSNPATVSEALKYIPNLQKQVEALCERKKELLSSLSKRRENLAFSRENQRENDGVWSSSSAVSAHKLNEREVAVQISIDCFQTQRVPLSQVLLSLEEDGLHPLNVSSSQSFGGRLFYTLHLEVEQYNVVLPCRNLNDKLMRLYENVDSLHEFSVNNFGFPSMM